MPEALDPTARRSDDEGAALDAEHAFDAREEHAPPEERAWDTALRALFATSEEPAARAVAESVLAQLPVAAEDPLALRLRSLDGAPPSSPLVPRSVEIDLRAGRIGRLRLVREIARGGVGVVLEAFDPDLGRSVAVKVLREELAGNFALVQRFVEEAQIGGQLQHPGIVPVYELGLDATRRPYFAMRLVEGRTMASSLRASESGASASRENLAHFERVCQTVAYAHARGVVHRDLKPANVMLGAYGETLVMDWGLAKVLGRREPDRAADAQAPAASPAGASARVETLRSQAAADAQLSQSGERLGTPAYMAPEQARGERDAIDERADVWALGAMLFEIACGESWHQPEAPPRSARERLAKFALEPELAHLIERCLELEPAARPRDAGEVAAALSAHLAGAEARARAAVIAAAAAETRTREERKAKRLGLSLAAALAASLVLAALFLGDRRARSLALEAQVASAIESASAARARGDFDVARAALDRAAGALDAAGADPSSDDALAAERTRVEAEARVADLRLELLRLRTNLSPPHLVDETNRRFFAELGVSRIDDASRSVKERAAELIARAPELRAEIAGVLQDWGHRKRRQGDPALRFLDLFDVAQALDDDPARAALRAAIRGRSAEVVKNAVREIDPSTAPLATIHLAAEALDAWELREESRALLLVAVERAPDELWTRWQLARQLARGGPEQRAEAELHAAVARTLHPDRLDPLLPAPERGPGPPRRDGPPHRPERRGF
ncbi:MAG: serine/threonine protein kinase [Planctomycetes bacterium]|nr:serine/threonine protein kinase [Planctomycetota bacterium]